MRAMALLAALAIAPPLAAQDHGVPGRASDYMQRMDTDQDRRVSLPEYQAWMGYAFTRMDRDGDGVLAPGELPGGEGEPVSLDTHRARLAARFQRQDRDGDGYLDAAELTAPPR